MMATEKIEIQIIAKGKPAEKAIKGVEKKTKDLGKQAKKTGKDTDGMLTKMKAGWIAVGAAMAISVSKAATFERASIGLTRSQKDWSKETALATDIQAEQVAGFLKSAKTAGLNEEAQRKLAKQAIALGYAFPHEDAETLHDNLVMLAKTGEAQGFVVDILEQKYVGLGDEISTLDLKTKSWTEKMELVNEVVEESQRQMDSSTFKEYQETIGNIDKALTSLGETIVTIATESGALGLFNKLLGASDLLLKRVHLGVLGLSGIFNETNEERKRWLDLAVSVLEQDEKLYGSDNQKRLKEYKKELAGINKELGIQEESEKTIITVRAGGAKALESQMTLFEKVRQTFDETYDGITNGFKKYIDEVKDGNKQYSNLTNVGLKAAKGLEDAFVNMAMGVKTSFKDMANAIMADLLRIIIRRNITTNLLGFFHTGTAEVKHSGGMIGVPSFHTGVRSDERLAKLQVGEAVINRGGAAKNRASIEAMNKGYAVGGGAGQVTTAEINFNVQAIDANSFNNYLVNNRDTIEGIINASLTSNGSVRRTIRQTI